MEERYVQVGDVKTRYATAGESGPALVLIHGLGASLESWYMNIEPLALQHRVFAPDVVWFGKSDKPERDITLDYFAQHIIEFMDAVDVERAVLVGNSLGGMIATKTALNYPERISGLVLVAPAGYGRELSWWFRIRTILRFETGLSPSKSALRLALSLVFHDPRIITDEMLDYFMDASIGSPAHTNRVLCAGVDVLGMKEIVLRDIRDSAHQLTMPTLIVWGKQDRLIPAKHATVAQHRIPHADLHLFDGCGHAPMIEKADEFNELLARFVRERVIRPERRDHELRPSPNSDLQTSAVGHLWASNA